MGRIPDTLFTDFTDGQTVHAADLNREREIMRVAINDFDDKVNSIIPVNAQESIAKVPVLETGLASVNEQLAERVTLSKFPRIALETNDNGRLKRAFDYLTSVGGGKLDIFNESLFIARLDLNGIEIPENIHITNYKTTYQMETNTYERYGIFYIKGVENVSIDGGIFLGDRATHTVTEGTGGNGVLVNGGINISLTNLIIKNFCGDGIGITDTDEFQGNNDVYLKNIYVENCRRQGISICNGKVVGENITCVDIRGTEPGAGIDIEPNNEDDLIDVYIRNLTTINCQKGLLVFPSIFAGTSKKFNVRIDNHMDDRGGVGLVVSFPIINSITGGFDGIIKIDKLSYSNNEDRAIHLVDWNKDAPTIKLSNIDIKNANTRNSNLIPAIGIERLNNNFDYTIGNIFMNGINIDSPQSEYGVWVNDSKDKINNIFMDGINNINVKASEIRNDSYWLQNYGIQNIGINSYFSEALAKKQFIKSNSDAFTVLDLRLVDTKGNEIEIINTNSSYIVVTIPVGSNIYPTNTSFGSTGFNVMEYSRVTLTCDGTNFFITGFIGTITPRN